MSARPNCCRVFTKDTPPSVAGRFERLRDVLALAPYNGGIVELGVAGGASFRCWTHLLHRHHGTGRLVGIDTFAGLPELLPQDGDLSPQIGKRVGGVPGEPDAFDPKVPAPSFEEVVARQHRVGEQDGGWFDWRWWLHQGDVCERLPDLAKDLDLRPALVFFDTDLYAPTKAGLEILWPRLLPGGICVFDEYGHTTWPGETLAANEFAVSVGLKVEPLNLGDYAPTAFLRKP